MGAIPTAPTLCRYSLTARTLGFHPRDRSSILRSDTCPFNLMAKCQLGRLVMRVRFSQRAYVRVCKLVKQTDCKSVPTG